MNNQTDLSLLKPQTTASPLTFSAIEDESQLGESSPDGVTSDVGAALDAQSHGIVASVLHRDTVDARESLARRFTAEAWTDHRWLKHAQERVGTFEQMQAIRRTGACHDARFWLITAWCFVLVDAVLWFIATAQAFAF